MSLLQLQLPLSQFKSLNLSTPFLHGTSVIVNKPTASTQSTSVNVEVVRLAPHPKYKRRVRKKKKFQAHDPENQFQIGDSVQLEKCKPISKKKMFLAIPIPKKTSSKQTKDVATQDLGIP